MEHPFLSNANIVQFDSLQPQFIVNDVEESIRISQHNIDKIKQIPIEQSQFENTIRAFDNALISLKDVMYKINILVACRSDIEEYSKANEVIFTKQVEFKASVYADDQLFSMIEKVFNSRENLEFDQKRLTEEIYNDFIDGGAKLNEQNKLKLIELKKEISNLSKQFLSNVVNATDDYSLLIENKTELEGVPESAIELYLNEAKKRDLKGYLITLRVPSFLPIMKYCKNERIRKELFLKSNSLCSEGQFDNTNIVFNALKKRQELAELLGFKNYSQYITKRRMVKSDVLATKFVEELHSKTLPFFLKEETQLRQFKKDFIGDDELMPWDINYCIEQLKQKHFDFNGEELRQYFPEPTVFKVLFEVYKRLYGITFQYNKDVKGWHPDVKYFDVIDSNNETLGGVYYDLFPRKGKRAGGFHDVLRMSYLKENGEFVKPLGVIVCNFAPPNSNGIAYFNHDELKTFFHESGHLMHTMFSNQRYASFSGMNVAWDFVELPSQIMENWTFEKEVLHLFNEIDGIQEVPKELFDKLIKSKNFMSGYVTMRQLCLGKTDLELHQHFLSSNETLDDFIEKIQKSYTINFNIKTLSNIRQFNHLFMLTYCYASGYYSYKWAETLEADAFELFKQNGIFNKTIANKFKSCILQMGGSKPADELYREFRGRDPDTSFLLKKLSLV